MLPLPFSGSLASPRKELIHLSGAPVFATAAQGTPPDSLALVASGAHTCSPTGLYTLHSFKSCCLRVWLPVSLNPGAETLPFGTLTGLGTHLLLGASKNIIGCLRCM